MLAMNSYSRRYRMPCTATTFSTGGPGANLLSRPRLPLRSFMKPKSSLNLPNFETTPFCRSKRFKSRKVNGCQKNDAIKKKTPDYTENAYREAVSKLKYLLAESYAPRLLTGKVPRDRVIYRRSNPRINETPEDSDDRSISECSRAKGFPGTQFEDSNLGEEKSRRLVAASQNSVFPARDLQSPSELTSFIARQEEYIEQLERESQYCKEELKNLLEKIREVVAENEALHDKNKAGLLKTFLREHESCDENKSQEKPNLSATDTWTSSGKKPKVHQTLEGPNIVFESRISELEAQLTQARIELKNAREDSEANAKRLSESSGNQASPEFAVQLDQALREKRELNGKLEEALRNLQAARDRENEVTQKAKRSTELAQQAEFDKYQADAEIRRLNDELDRQREKLREASQEASRRVAEERSQVERRFSQQVEQLSADVASHWDAASKSHMETEKQRRELGELKRDLVQKQAMIDDLKKELQNKISNLQSDLSQALAEKDAAEQEVAAAKLAIERSERHARQEQSRWQTEINSYKQRLERADADIVHCRRENLRLSEQIASLEKEINMAKLVRPPEVQTSAITPKADGEKDLTTMIMDMETKHAATVGGLEDALSNQAKLVSRLTAECQSLTQRLEANDRTHKRYVDKSVALYAKRLQRIEYEKYLKFNAYPGNSVLTEEPVAGDDGGGINLTTTPSKKKRTVKVDLKVKVTPKKKSSITRTVKLPLSAQEEMASLQSNLEYLSSKINDTLENKKAVEQALISDRNNAQHSEESMAPKTQNSASNEYSNSAPEKQPYTSDYMENPNDQFEDENADYERGQESVEPDEAQVEGVDNSQDYALQDGRKYEGQEYQSYPAEYSNQDYAQYEQYDPSMYQQNPSGEDEQLTATEDAAYQQDPRHYEEYPTENYPDNQNQQLPTDKQNFTKPTTIESTRSEA